MEFFLFTISWMALNSLLAAIPVFAGIGMEKVKNLPGRIIFAIIWVLFLPNTIYVLTDPFHIIDDFRKIGLVTTLVTLPLYGLLVALGIITFVLSIYPLEHLTKKLKKSTQLSWIILVNMLIGVGVTLGRIERLNSWEVITNIPKTLQALQAVITSVNLFLITLIFAATATLVYLTFKNNKTLRTWYKKYS
jgi:uncharacterized membrane protein